LGWNAPDGSLLAEDLRGWASGLADAYATESRAADQFFANRATDLLSAWEFRVGLPIRPNASTADRQAALAAKRSASGGDVRGRLLAAVRKIDPTATIETNPATAVASTDPRAVFRFVVIVSVATFENADKRAAIVAVLEQMKPAYAGYTIATGTGFIFGVSLFGYDTF
jgi:uncharacterized protein YmfQ (DUF2313 family)